MTYPPEPWRLFGHCWVGIFAVPSGADVAPSASSALPPGARPITLAGRRIVATAFFVYEAPSPLTYNEVMCTVLVRRGLRPFVHIPFIQVDSPASRDGGRGLWSIPKELNTFTAQAGVHYSADEVARLTVARTPRHALPWIPLRFSLLQGTAAAGARTRVRGRVRAARGRGSWEFEEAGPLGFLADRRPVITIAVPAFRLRFGGGDTQRWGRRS